MVFRQLLSSTCLASDLLPLYVMCVYIDSLHEVMGNALPSHLSLYLSLYLSLNLVVEAICAINTAVVSGDSLAILRSLTVSSAGVRSITDECAQTYLEKLAAAKQHKIDTGEWWWALEGLVYGSLAPNTS